MADHTPYISRVVEALEAALLVELDWDGEDDERMSAWISLPAADGTTPTLIWDDERGWRIGEADADNPQTGIGLIESLPFGRIVAHPDQVVDAVLHHLDRAPVAEDVTAALAAYQTGDGS